jgi:hypothetical protein
MNKPQTHNGIYYWPTFTDARDWAASQGLTLSSSPLAEPRIVMYQRGAAIQIRISGPYLGPDHVKI